MKQTDWDGKAQEAQFTVYQMVTTRVVPVCSQKNVSAFRMKYKYSEEL